MAELVSSASSLWMTGTQGGLSMVTSRSLPACDLPLLEVGLLSFPSLSSSGRGPVHSMGGGPRTFPGGVTKWQWKRMQIKKTRQIEKARLMREKHMYEARRRAELMSASPVLEMPWQRMSRIRPRNYVTADEQIVKLAARFQKQGAEDLWTEKDGPAKFEVMDDEQPRRWQPRGSPQRDNEYFTAPAHNAMDGEDTSTLLQSLKVDDFEERNFSGHPSVLTSHRHLPPIPPHYGEGSYWSKSRGPLLQSQMMKDLVQHAGNKADRQTASHNYDSWTDLKAYNKSSDIESRKSRDYHAPMADHSREVKQGDYSSKKHIPHMESRFHGHGHSSRWSNTSNSSAYHKQSSSHHSHDTYAPLASKSVSSPTAHDRRGELPRLG